MRTKITCYTLRHTHYTSQLRQSIKQSIKKIQLTHTKIKLRRTVRNDPQARNEQAAQRGENVRTPPPHGRDALERLHNGEAKRGRDDSELENLRQDSSSGNCREPRDPEVEG